MSFLPVGGDDADQETLHPWVKGEPGLQLVPMDRGMESVPQPRLNGVRLGPNGGSRRAFSFKLELADGRWCIDEKELDTAPQIGDIVSFDDGKSWRVRATHFVRAMPSKKPVREFFVCAPVG
jgi:hypothetical protein